MAPNERVTDDEYRRLLEFRTAMRKFLQYSKEQAEELDLTPTQHQLLLAIRGHAEEEGPTMGDVAGHLLIRHHSAVELVNRAERAGLVERRSDEADQRIVRLVLTSSGAAKLERISRANLSKLGRLGPDFQELLNRLSP
jgi:DNA-binding MarR family transcriptional regulator